MSVEVNQWVEVPVDPVEAFRIFTEEYNDWWVRSTTTFFDGARAKEMRIEPGVGGRILEVYDDATGEALERGRITVWEPGQQLVFIAWDGSEACFRFEPAGAGTTRVSVEHRRHAGHEPTAAVAGTLRAMLRFFSQRAGNPAHRSWAGRDLPRVIPVLHYRDPSAAARWLMENFGFEGSPPSEPLPADFPIPLRLGEGAVIVVGGNNDAAGDDHSVYVYVDDLDGHHAAVAAQGASIVRGIRSHGDRSYVAEDLAGRRWTFAQSRPTQRARNSW